MANIIPGSSKLSSTTMVNEMKTYAIIYLHDLDSMYVILE